MREPGEGIPKPSKDTSGQPKENVESVQAIMKSAVIRRNEMEKMRKSPRSLPISDKTRFYLEITDTGVNNQLAIAVINSVKDPVAGNEAGGAAFVSVGHYDPGMQRFLFYPELLPENEARVIEQLATDRRKESVRQQPKFDYDADVIRNLHKRHRQVLLEDGLIFKIAERYNDLPPEKKTAGLKEHLIDNSTSFNVCLTPKLGGYKRSDPSSVQASNLFITDDAVVSIALHGDLFRDNGVMRRYPSSYIHIGFSDLDDPNGKLVPRSKLVTNDEFAKITALTSELQQLKATSQPNLDTKMVALKNKS